MLTRRTLLKGLIGGVASALVLPDLVVGEEATRRYWAIDRTHFDPAFRLDGMSEHVFIDGLKVPAYALETGDFDASIAPFTKFPTRVAIGDFTWTKDIVTGDAPWIVTKSFFDHEGRIVKVEPL